jgi:heme A synthase
MDALTTPLLMPAASPAPGSRVASWLGVLLVMLCCLNVAGGWVRLSGAGVAIPQWPLIELDGGRKTLLPPLDTAGWEATHAAWATHQEMLLGKANAGQIHSRALGRQPTDLSGFQVMFLTEWLHRLLAASVGLLALGCLGTVLADRQLRRRIGVPVAGAVGLIVVQAVIGALLIDQGTSTRWLFIHQGNAALVLACVLTAILRLVTPESANRVSSSRTLVLTTGLAAGLAWCELMVGGLLAASRHHLPPGGLLGLDAGPLWWSAASTATNLLDNASFHHVLHRILAVLLTLAVLVGLIQAHRRGAGERLRLALAVAATFTAIQAILGLASAVVPAGEVTVPLAHLFLGHALILVLILAWREARHPAEDSAGQPVPA